MKDNSKTNTLLLTVIGVATLLVAVIGATFAYFTAQVGGGESATTVKMNAGVLKINFTNGNTVQTGNTTSSGVVQSASVITDVATIDGQDFATHKHSGVQTGGGQTGGVV